MMYRDTENNGYSVHHCVNVAGLDYNSLISKLGALWENNSRYLKISENAGCFSVGFTANAETLEKAEQMSDNAIANIKRRLKEYAYGVNDESLEEIIFSLLGENGVTVATAEFYGGAQISADLLNAKGNSSAPIKHLGNYSADEFGLSDPVFDYSGGMNVAAVAEMSSIVRTIGDSDIGIAVFGYPADGDINAEATCNVCCSLFDGEHIWVTTANFSETELSNSAKFVKDYSATFLLNTLRRFLLAENSFLNLGVDADSELNVVNSITGEVTTKNYTLKKLRGDNKVESAPQKAEVADAKEPAVSKKSNKKDKKKRKKKPFWKCVIPVKGDRVIDVILKIVAIIAAVTFIVSGSYVANYWLDANKQQDIIDDAKETIDFEDDTIDEETQTLSKFDGLVAQNSDFRAWIRINNTKVDNPVYQHTDNEYYIKYNMENKRNAHGALFIDTNCKLSAEERSQNIIVYGHSMNDGTMFGNLRRFRRLDFYQQNPTISFETLYSPATEYKIFSIFVTNSTPEENDGYVFNYTIPDFETESTFLAWVNDVRERSFFDLPVDVEAGDELITLSTCDYDFSGARLVIVARKTREGEATSVDTSSAKKNPNPIMPQGWYKAYS